MALHAGAGRGPGHMNRLPQGAGSVAPTIPATQTVSFGSKTRVGFGGHPLTYVGAGTLAITVGTGSTHWQIDNRNHLVPKNGAGAYGSAPPTFSGPYTLTIGDGVVSSIVTVNMVAATAHWREMTSTPGAVNQDDPLADTAFGPPYKSQLNYYTDRSPVLADNDHIVMRDGHLNPAGVTWGLGIHASYAGVHLTIESETVDVANDANGNPRLAHGGKFGHLYLAPATTGLSYPFEFKNLQFTNDTALHTLFQQQFAGAVLDLKMTSSFVGFGPSVSSATVYNNNVEGIQCDSITVTGCRITNVNTGFTGGSTTAHPSSLISNIFHGCTQDNINFDGVGWTITDNFIFDAIGPVAGHPDSMQLNGQNGDNTNLNFATITGNIAVGDISTVTQGIGFLTNQSSAGDFKGLVFENNASVMCGANGAMFAGIDNPTIRFNTVIGDVSKVLSGVNFNSPGPPYGTDLTSDRNVTNAAPDYSAQLGTVTSTNAVTLTATTAAMDIMYPNLRAALTAGITNRAAAIVALTAAATAQASGGAMLADGSYAGAYNGDGSLNRGLAATSRVLTSGETRITSTSATRVLA